MHQPCYGSYDADVKAEEVNAAGLKAGDTSTARVEYVERPPNTAESFAVQ
jgi:hypothetical protein